jgi:hypothetical protein
MEVLKPLFNVKETIYRWRRQEANVETFKSYGGKLLTSENICEAVVHNLARKEGLPARRNRSAARSQSMHGLETRSLFYRFVQSLFYRFVQWRTLHKKKFGGEFRLPPYDHPLSLDIVVL